MDVNGLISPIYNWGGHHLVRFLQQPQSSKLPDPRNFLAQLGQSAGSHETPDWRRPEALGLGKTSTAWWV